MIFDLHRGKWDQMVGYIRSGRGEDLIEKGGRQ